MWRTCCEQTQKPSCDSVSQEASCICIVVGENAPSRPGHAWDQKAIVCSSCFSFHASSTAAFLATLDGKMLKLRRNMFDETCFSWSHTSSSDKNLNEDRYTLHASLSFLTVLTWWAFNLRPVRYTSISGRLKKLSILIVPRIGAGLCSISAVLGARLHIGFVGNSTR